MANTDDFFKSANLTGYPFNINHSDVRQAKAGIWAGYDSEKSLLEDLILEPKDYHSTVFQFLYGDYGVGKTHALRWLGNYILEKHKDEFNSVVYIMDKVVHLSKFDFVQSYNSYILEDSDFVEDVRKFSIWFDKIKIKHPDYDSISIEEIAFDLTNSRKLTKVITDLNDLHNDKTSVLEYLTLKGNASEKQEKALNNLVNFFNLFTMEMEVDGKMERYKEAVYMLIDEYDLIGDCSPKDASTSAQLVRRLYDDVAESYCLLLAATATAGEREGLISEYLISRLTNNEGIVLEILLSSDIPTFIIDILGVYRDDPQDNKRNKYFPYDEDFIKQLADSVIEAQPRKLFQKLGLALKIAERHNLDLTKKLITSDYIIQYKPTFFDD